MPTRRPTTIRAQDLVFTLYGDYLLQRAEPVWAGALVTLLGRLGMKPMAVRTTLSRMSAKGWLVATRRGSRSYYGLTPRGRRLLEEGRQRIYHPPRATKWDGRWHLVSYSIPESRRHLRDSLRVRLASLGCGAVGPGLWMSPHDIRHEVADLAASLKIAKYIEVFRAEHIAGSSEAEIIARCWDLEALNKKYLTFLKHWRPQAEHCSSCRGLTVPAADLECQQPASCFVRRFTLVHDYRAFALLDPYLPAELLPPDWAGAEAAEIFERYHDVLTLPAERYVRDVCDAGEGGAHVELYQLKVS